MKDLQLSDTGDIIFYQDNLNKEKLNLSFYVSDNKAIKLSFRIIDNNQDKTYPNNTLKISFDVNNNIKQFNAIVLDDYGSLLQLLRNRIVTSLNDIKDREEYGSKLELTRHIKVNDEKNKQLVIQYIKDSISDIAPNAAITILDYTDNNIYFTSGYKIRITINETNYDLEV